MTGEEGMRDLESRSGLFDDDFTELASDEELIRACELWERCGSSEMDTPRGADAVDDDDRNDDIEGDKCPDVRRVVELDVRLDASASEFGSPLVRGVFSLELPEEEEVLFETGGAASKTQQYAYFSSWIEWNATWGGRFNLSVKLFSLLLEHALLCWLQFNVCPIRF